MVIAETKLLKADQTDFIQSKVGNWMILRRYDSDSGKKNMGLLLLSPRKDILNEIEGITHHTAKHDDSLQIQGLIIKLKCKLSLGFVYCRSTPNNADISYIKKVYGDCSTIMGDLNISHRIDSQKSKLSFLCDDSRVSILNEITRSLSNNQLDYVLVQKWLEDNTFSTSFYNFISDHKSITLRIGLNNNNLKDEILQKLNFDAESHLKARCKQPSVSIANSISDMSISSDSDIDELANHLFNRRFLNVGGCLNLLAEELLAITTDGC